MAGSLWWVRYKLSLFHTRQWQFCVLLLPTLVCQLVILPPPVCLLVVYVHVRHVHYNNSKNNNNFIENLLEVLTDYDGGDGDDDCGGEKNRKMYYKSHWYCCWYSYCWPAKCFYNKNKNILLCSKNVFGYFTLFSFYHIIMFWFLTTTSPSQPPPSSQTQFFKILQPSLSYQTKFSNF